MSVAAPSRLRFLGSWVLRPVVLPHGSVLRSLPWLVVNRYRFAVWAVAFPKA